jgi:hypothetical protein
MAAGPIGMIFIFLGIALVVVEALALAGRLGPLLFPIWARIVMPLLVVAIAWRRWPRERLPWAIFGTAVLFLFLRDSRPFASITTLVVITAGLYLAAYGWKTRKIDRVRDQGRRISPILILAGWLLICLLIFYIIPRL